MPVPVPITAVTAPSPNVLVTVSSGASDMPGGTSPRSVVAGSSGAFSIPGGAAPTPSVVLAGSRGAFSIPGGCASSPNVVSVSGGASSAPGGAAPTPSVVVAGSSGAFSVPGGAAASASAVMAGSSGVLSIPGLPKFDEDWIRLAIVVHEFSCEAVEWVLDDAICKKHVGLAHKAFEEKLEDALRIDRPQLTRSLLSYQVPVVFPASGYGKYADFDVGIVRNLIKFFIGSSDWKNATAGLPAIENLKTYNWSTTNPLALVALLADFRNWTFHHTGSVSGFDQLWHDLVKILDHLNFDTRKVSHFKSGLLDYSSKVVVKTIHDALGCVKVLLSEARRLQMDHALRCDVFQQQALKTQERLLEDFEISKEELVNHRDRLEMLQTQVEELLVCQDNADSASSERKRRAQEACWSVHEEVLSSRELDLFGDQIKGLRKEDLMVSLATVDCSDVDAVRLNSANEIHDLLSRSFKSLKAVAIQDIFKDDKIALVRGYPGAGKSTFCHFVLKEWQAGRLWSEQFDFVFYINAPLLMTLLDEPPFNMERVLKALYRHVFTHISFDELSMFNYMIIVDAIDECDVDKICARKPSTSFEEAIKKIIKSPENFHRIIVGRPHACDNVRLKLLAGINFQFVEVVGFTSDQVREYVMKFCSRDQVKSENLWRKINDNPSLLAMSHLPIFANVLCNVLTENANVKIETQTELYVWTYFVLLTRHCKGKHSDEVNKGTFGEMFGNEKLIDALVNVSNMAYENLTTGKIFFKSSDMEVKGIASTFVSPFIVHRKEYLSFAHLSCMEFFAAVHMFISGVKLDREIISHERLRNVLPMLFGLLGVAVRNSESPEILLEFILPLIKKFNLRPTDKHPLSGDIGRAVFQMDRFHDLFVRLFWEFRNPGMLRAGDLYWENGAELLLRHYHLIDPVVYLVENVIRGERRVEWLSILPIDEQLSLVEMEKLRDCLLSRGENVDELQLCWISPSSEEEMEVLADVCSLVSTVSLHFIQAWRSELWLIFLESLKKAKQNQTLRLKRMLIYDCNMDDRIRSELRELGIDVRGK